MRLIVGSSGTPVQAFDQDAWASTLQYGKRVLEALARSLPCIARKQPAMLKALPAEDWEKFGVTRSAGNDYAGARTFATTSTTCGRSRALSRSLKRPRKRSGSRSTVPAVKEQGISKETVVGAAPAGARDRRAAAAAVREMFTSIAPRYDLLNHVLSFNIDRMWRRRTARVFRDILIRPEARVLDLCCGTGDMTFALHRQAGRIPRRFWVPCFSHAMLQRAAVKSAGAKRGSRPGWVEADALNLPFPSAHFDLVTSAFGFRSCRS